MSKKEKNIYHLKEEERPLREKQKLFCEEYIKTLNATRSYKKIYNCTQKTAEVNGTVLLRNTRVQEYIKERLNKIEKEKIASADEILEYLTSVVRGEAIGYEIVVESIGDYSSKAREVKKRPNEKEKLKAAELLGKRYRLFEGNKEQQQEENDTTKPTIEIKIVDNSNLEELMYEEK